MSLNGSATSGSCTRRHRPGAPTHPISLAAILSFHDTVELFYVDSPAVAPRLLHRTDERLNEAGPVGQHAEHPVVGRGRCRFTPEHAGRLERDVSTERGSGT
jgi:hypothetical protein